MRLQPVSLIGRSCGWRFNLASTAMGRSPDIGQHLQSNHSFLIPHLADVDPLRTSVANATRYFSGPLCT